MTGAKLRTAVHNHLPPWSQLDPDEKYAYTDITSAMPAMPSLPHARSRGVISARQWL
jgi:hypothetical protein